MTENYPPASGPPTNPPAPVLPEYPPAPPHSSVWGEPAFGGPGQEAGAGETSSAGQGTADLVKDQASDLGQGAVQAGKHTAVTAKEQTSAVASEAARQGRDLARQAQDELTAQASQQQKRLAGSLHALGDELASMASQSARPGMATDLVQQAAGSTRNVASWLEEREPGQLLEEVKTFARKRPALFIALAAGAGLVGGRLTRGLTDGSSDDAPAPVPEGALAPLPEPTAPGGAPADDRFATVLDEDPVTSAWSSPVPDESPFSPGQAGGSR
jgi:hypothetical protein